MTTSDQTDRVLRLLRNEISALETRVMRTEAEWRRGAVACGLAGGMLALTVAPWVSLAKGREPRHLWQLVDDHPIALVCLGLILALGLLTFNMTDSRIYHGVLAGIGGGAAVTVLFAGTGEESDYTAATGRWLMFFAVAGLITLHASWAADKQY